MRVSGFERATAAESFCSAVGLKPEGQVTPLAALAFSIVS